MSKENRGDTDRSSPDYFQIHTNWLCRLPGFVSEKLARDETALLITEWIDEYTHEFADSRSCQLSQLIDESSTGLRILNLISTNVLHVLRQLDAAKELNCRISQFRPKKASLKQDAFDLITERKSNSFAATLTQLRTMYRVFGDMDGVRHCVMVGAIDEGQNKAISEFQNDFAGLLKGYFRKQGVCDDGDVDDGLQEFFIKHLLVDTDRTDAKTQT